VAQSWYERKRSLTWKRKCAAFWFKTLMSGGVGGDPSLWERGIFRAARRFRQVRTAQTLAVPGNAWGLL
jgi:hypothetical protein